jgi:hypothetical protein
MAITTIRVTRRQRLLLRFDSLGITIELTHAGPNDVNREAELSAPSGVVCSDLVSSHVLLLLNLEESDNDASECLRARQAAEICRETIGNKRAITYCRDDTPNKKAACQRFVPASPLGQNSLLCYCTRPKAPTTVQRLPMLRDSSEPQGLRELSAILCRRHAFPSS